MEKDACNKRISKSTGLEKNKDAFLLYLRAIDDFRQRMRFTKFIRIKPFIDFLKVPSRKKDFQKFVDDLEEFRSHVLGMKESLFYRIDSEFILSPNGRSYYNPIHIFGCDGSYEAEEFRNRIFETLTCISFTVGLENKEQETLNFIGLIDELNITVDVRNILPKSKNWFCIETVRRMALEKGWTIEDTLGKVKNYYRQRIRKVYPEMFLMDMVHGEFDKVKVNSKEKKIPKHIEAIEQEDWYGKWEEGLPG
jgi:hypothetical protein